jgi:TP901 family phage tail tape measure protein
MIKHERLEQLWKLLAGAVDNFKKALGLADDEWEHSLSLIREYEESLLSTKSQLAVLKNNVTEIALTLGETLLPVLNHLIQVAVPGIRKLTEVFRNMSPQMMKMLVVGLAIAGLAGPMIFFLSQVVFGFSMVWISVGRAAQLDYLVRQ